jgi:hypothetical protein
MLPAERGAGQLLHLNMPLCDVLYETDYPLGFANVFHVQRIRFSVQDYDPSSLLELTDLILVTADGAHHPLTQELQSLADGRLECTLNSQA